MKSDVFNNELDFIVRPDVREFARTVLEDAPDYFFNLQQAPMPDFTQRMSWVRAV